MQFKIFHSDLNFTSEKSMSKSFLPVSIVPSLAEMLVYDGLYLNVKIYGFKQFQSKNNFSSIIIDAWGIITHWYKISRIDFTHSYNIFCKNAREPNSLTIPVTLLVRSTKYVLKLRTYGDSYQLVNLSTTTMRTDWSIWGRPLNNWKLKRLPIRYFSHSKTSFLCL